MHETTKDLVATLDTNRIFTTMTSMSIIMDSQGEATPLREVDSRLTLIKEVEATKIKDKSLKASSRD